MFQTTVFTFCVLTDDHEVDVVVASLVARDVLDEDNVGVDVEFLTEGDVERDVTRTSDGSVEDTYMRLSERYFVAQ